MLLNRLQQQLESIYEVQSAYRVSDFLIHDPVLVQYLDTSPNARDVPEKLLIQREEDTLNLALYLDPAMLNRLEKDNPMEYLHKDNLHDFWLALEGISHFLYFTWNAGYERRVSLMELELQAEVDKYVAAAFLLGNQSKGVVPRSLYQLLFRHFRFDDRLTKEEIQRYRRASDFAGKFCSYVEYQLTKGYPAAGLVNTLRRFYRLTRQPKIRAIARL